MKFNLTYLVFILTTSLINSQIFINEASNANGNTIVTPSGDTPDWIEIYNNSSQNVQLGGYALSDKRSEPLKWKLPMSTLGANQFLTILASGYTKIKNVDHYETAVYPNYNWKYVTPDASTSPNWKNLNFNDNSWTNATLGIGYGDNDDATALTQQLASIYVRHEFIVSDTSSISEAILDIDFDDGFVAYLNGVEIARSGLIGFPPAWDELASDHEAMIYQGGNPGRFFIDYNLLKSCLLLGNNVLSIEIHNAAVTSSDITLIPFLTFGLKNENVLFGGTVHDWFDLQTNTGLECNFTIKPEGEAIYLSDSLGQIIDSVFVPDLDADMSFGRTSDGNPNFGFFQLPTPGSSNNLSLAYTKFEATPTIQKKGGFFTNAIKVAVTNNSSENGIIRYTLDGQNPTINSTIYTDSISLNTNTVLKVACFSINTNVLPSSTTTESYFFMEDFTIPVISLTTDNANLYGTDGIFDNYWTDWKRPCFIEYYDEDGVKQFDTKASIKSDGGAGGSRGNPQHSVTIEPLNSTYGAGKPIHYPLIPEKSFIKDYSAFYLRNGSNMWNAYPQKDATFMRMMRETKVNSQAYSPVIVFLNGQYFGVYELREKANSEYFKSNYGNNPDSLDLLSISYFYAPSVIRTVEGNDSSFFNMKDFVATYDPAAPDYFEKCHQKLDMYSFADYLAGENWFGNFDWIYNNMKIFRTQEKGNRWRFNLQDMEIGLGSWSDYNSDLFDYLETQNLPNPFQEMYMGMMQNQKFKNYYLNRYADLMNTIFQEDYYLPLTLEMYEQLIPEMPRHFQLWTGDVAGGMATYEANRDAILYQFSNRNAAVRNQIVNRFALDKQVSVTLDVNPPGAGYIKISTIVPETLPWTGVYFDGVPVEITAVPNPGFEFVDWTANDDIPNNEISKSALLLNIDNDGLFQANFIGDTSELSVTISEINYNSDPTINGGNWIELHNYGSKAVSLDAWKLHSKQQYESFDIPIKTSIDSNGYLVICEDTNLFKKIYPNITNFIGATEFGWDNSRDTIKLTNTFGKLMITATYSDSLPYPECADGWGRTLELTNDQADLNNSSSWFCGCIKGSPGKKYEPCFETLSITEISHYSVTSPNNAGDWIELKNNTSSSINLQNYVFKDSKDDHQFILPNYELLPNQYVVLLNDQTAFSTQSRNVLNTIGTFSFGLSSNKEVLRLYNEKEIISSVLYRNTDGWPTLPAESNYTLERKMPGTYNNPNDPNSWFAGCFQGSPGKAYSECLFLDKDDIIGIYPNPGKDDIWIVFNNDLTDYPSVNLRVFDMRGRIIFEKSVSSTDKLIGEKLDISAYEFGMYYVSISYGGEKIQKPFVKF